jgi:phosphate butyryltransferase
MFRSFADIEKYLLSNGIKKRVALAGSQDPDALASIVKARQVGLVEVIGFGDADETKRILSEMGENPEDYELHHVSDLAETAKMACRQVYEGKADLPMKGCVPTASFMRAILDKTLGFFREGQLLSQATILEYAEETA